MPTLEWIGKSKVINHHQDVPFRVLERKEALKALLPRYEGRVKCIYIDIKTPRLIQFNCSSADFAA